MSNTRSLYKKAIIASIFITAVAGATQAAAAEARHPHTPAGPQYFGGGTTVPTIGYAGKAAVSSSNPITAPSYSSSGGEVSAFGFYLNQLVANPAATSLSYCQTGSDFGKYVFDGSGNAGKTCNPFVVGDQLFPNSFGFGATSQTFADFAATDAPLSAAEYGSFSSNAGTSGSNNYGRGEAVQLPAAVSSIAVIYNNSDVAGRLNLTSSQLCQIFDGEVGNWNQLDASLPSKTIRLIYRGESNAATYALSNHLNAVCNGDGETYALDGKFSRVLPSPLPTGASTSNFTASLGNPLETALVGQFDGALGYVETANALAQSSSVKTALIDGKDPVLNLPEAAASIPAFGIFSDVAVGAYVQNGRPGLDTLPATTAACVQLVLPGVYAVPSDGYPILSVSYLLFSSAGNGTKASDLQKLGAFLSQATTYPAATAGNPRVNTIDSSNSTGSGKAGIASFVLDGSVGSTVQAAAQNCIGS